MVGAELFVEAFWCLGVLAFVLGFGSSPIMVGMLAWDGGAAAWFQPAG